MPANSASPDFVAATAAQAGLDIELQEVLPQRTNVLARLAPRGPVTRRVILAPHLDTVGGDDPALFQPRVRHDRIYGRGACDTKGSVACMLTALANLARSTSRPQQTEILFAALVDEENAQFGSRYFADSGFKADLAIVGEPTELRVVTAHKGDVWLRLIARGKAAHGARPDLGRNAVHLMARVVDLLETRYAAVTPPPSTSPGSGPRHDQRRRHRRRFTAQHCPGPLHHRHRSAHPARRKRRLRP